MDCGYTGKDEGVREEGIDSEGRPESGRSPAGYRFEENRKVI